MGFGDALIGTAIAKRARLKHPGKPICVGDGTAIEWVEEIHSGNPYLSKEIVPNCIWVHSHKGYRPYVDNEFCTAERMFWKKGFKVEPGELYLSEAEKHKWSGYSDFVYIEPNIKGWLGPNKDWGFDRWQAVVKALPEIRFVQGPGRKLDGVEQVSTSSFRDACSLLDHALLFVGTDGGLHHAAAALAKKAVVVWGGYTHPRNLGYDTHINLHLGGEPCGNLKPCSHCKKAMDRITVEMVVKAIKDSLGSLGTHSHERQAQAA